MIIACSCCNTAHEITAPKEAFDKYASGALIQEAFPMLSADERELLVSGICGTCFDLMFGDEE